MYTVDENDVVEVEVAVAHADLALSSPPIQHIYVRGKVVEKDAIMFKVEETTGTQVLRTLAKHTFSGGDKAVGSLDKTQNLVFRDDATLEIWSGHAVQGQSVTVSNSSPEWPPVSKCRCAHLGKFSQLFGVVLGNPLHGVKALICLCMNTRVAMELCNVIYDLDVR